MSTRRSMIPRSVQAKVVETYGGTCWLKFPGCTGRADTLDHLMPYSQGGTDSVTNLRPACRHCNSLRADRLVQGRGIEVHVLLCSPRISPRAGMPASATWLNYNAMLGMLATGRGVDDDVWRMAEGMWQGAVAKALRLPSAIPLVLVPPASVAVDRWREWLRLGYDLWVTDAHSTKDMRCYHELQALVAWTRSGISMRGVEQAQRARDDDWRRQGLVF